MIVCILEPTIIIKRKPEQEFSNEFSGFCRNYPESDYFTEYHFKFVRVEHCCLLSRITLGIVYLDKLEKPKKRV